LKGWLRLQRRAASLRAGYDRQATPFLWQRF
jgi:hypothetical protein